MAGRQSRHVEEGGQGVRETDGQLGDRSLLDAALAAGGITESLICAIADWTRQLPRVTRTETDRILLEAAAAGASHEDLATIAACPIEAWRQQQPAWATLTTASASRPAPRSAARR